MKGIIISGGPSAVFDAESPKPDARLFNSGVPVLGVCYGHQYIAYVLGGVVQQGSKEFGHSTIIPRAVEEIKSAVGENRAIINRFQGLV